MWSFTVYIRNKTFLRHFSYTPLLFHYFKLRLLQVALQHLPHGQYKYCFIHLPCPASHPLFFLRGHTHSISLISIKSMTANIASQTLRYFKYLKFFSSFLLDNVSKEPELGTVTFKKALQQVLKHKGYIAFHHPERWSRVSQKKGDPGGTLHLSLVSHMAPCFLLWYDVFLEF